MLVQANRFWACPQDGHFPLTLRADLWQEQEIWEGSCICPRCGAGYPIHAGLPDFLSRNGVKHSAAAPAEAAVRTAEDIQDEERGERNRVLMQPRTRRQMYEEKLEQMAVLRWLRPRRGESVLDAGCGVGRLTRWLLRRRCAVVGLDFAAARLHYLAASTRRAALVTGDLMRPPLREMCFDKIACLQVLEHLPTAEMRLQLLERLRDLLRPGGRLVLTVYHDGRANARAGREREGRHESGIFYHCYGRDELREQMHGFTRLRIAGLSWHRPGAYSLLPMLGPFGRRLDRLGSRLPDGLEWSQLLIARGQRPK